MKYLRSEMNVRLRKDPGLFTETLGEINEGAICYVIGRPKMADDLTWANIVAPALSGEWREGWAAIASDDDTLLSPYAPMQLGSPICFLSPVTQLFAENPTAYGKHGLLEHSGIDFGTPIGSRIVSVDAGTVSRARIDPPGYGSYVQIEHVWGVSLYAGLSEIHVTQGQSLQKGQLVGLSGSSGFCSGPCLHFELKTYPVKPSNGYGGGIDPLALIDRRFCNYLDYVPASLKRGLMNGS